MKIRMMILLLIAGLSASLAVAAGCSKVEGKTEMVAQAKDAAKGSAKEEKTAEKKSENTDGKCNKIFEPAPLGFSTCCSVTAHAKIEAPPEEPKPIGGWTYYPLLDQDGNPFNPFNVPAPPEYLVGKTVSDPYDLNQMRLVGVIRDPARGQYRAYIVFPNGMKKTVGIGDTLGKQGGVVVKIGIKSSGRALKIGNLTAEEQIGFVLVEERKIDPANPESEFVLQRELQAEKGALYKQ